MKRSEGFNYAEYSRKYKTEFSQMSHQELLDIYNKKYRLKQTEVPKYFGMLYRLQVTALHDAFMEKFNDSPYYVDERSNMVYSRKLVLLSGSGKLICQEPN